MNKSLRTRWINQNVNLMVLAESFKEFFESEGFNCVIEETENNFKILAVPSRKLNILDNIVVFIRGTPNDFTVDFVTGSNTRLYILVGGLTQLFGGGILLSKGLKSQEKLSLIEGKFWEFVEMKISSLGKKAGEMS